MSDYPCPGPLSEEEQRRCDDAGSEAKHVVEGAFEEFAAKLPPIRIEQRAMIAPEELGALRAEVARIKAELAEAKGRVAKRFLSESDYETARATLYGAFLRVEGQEAHGPVSAVASWADGLIKEQAAELAAIKERQCATCRHWQPTLYSRNTGEPGVGTCAYWEDAEPPLLTTPADVEHCDRCGRPAAKDAAQHYLHCEECDTGSLCQDCYDLHAMEGEILTLKREVARLTPLAAVGEAVEGMGNGLCLDHTGYGKYQPDDEAWMIFETPDIHGERRFVAKGPTALAALAAAKGEDDAV